MPRTKNVNNIGCTADAVCNRAGLCQGVSVYVFGYTHGMFEFDVSNLLYL